MASQSFLAAFAETVLGKNYEGGYGLTRISNDPGGWTFAGISRRYWPKWEGWALLDKGEPYNSPRLAELTQQFYFVNFWLPINGENLPPLLAQQVFDFAVNSDPDDAKLALQRALGNVKVDGDIGAKTVSAARGAEPLKLLMRFNAERLEHLAKTPQARGANIGGWFNRIADQLRTCTL